MARALDVARYLVHLATPTEDDAADTLCHLRLQKLLYYVQGWHLGATGQPLFSDRIGAWPHGPVVDSLYPVFKAFRLAVPPTEGADPTSLSEKDKTFVRSIWERYKRYSGLALRSMTHRETPWVEARSRCSPDDPYSSAEITPEAMRAFFFPRFVELLKRQDSRINPEKWQASADAIAAGQVRTAKDIRRELHNRRTGLNQG